ncbi:hypothetical protein BDV38DRAFT_233701 [Aspergillus pseudotamarii]|uniref:Nudix hydrolase domain-containing protein n=1 Tax=Aspergillus pseudotamarii TaxID=132259 RepID=A0A5N6TAT5_ASPPS|nr:uncharacterized protein BDV38DRAFT_233701 [Aspergillus pseudotamarii]KAE8143443.1 hypothetical protein BDV38DRAFT_233701 [Aspergillus pseudotamarii]
MSQSILDVVKECDNFTPSDGPPSHSRVLDKRYAFIVNGYDVTLGYIPRETFEKIKWSFWWEIDHYRRTVTLMVPITATSESRSRLVKETLQATRELGAISILENWRDETFPVYGPQGQVLLEIERCASALFGIVAYNVQLVCYITTEQGLQVWIGRRSDSEHKPTNSGMLNTTVAGGLPSGKLPIEALLWKAQEKASLPKDTVRSKVQSVGHLTYFHVQSRARGETGLLQPGVEYLYELELDASITPRSSSEVESFTLYTVKEVLHALKAGQFKPNSAIAITKFLISHRILNAENEPDYTEILSHLHRELEFPCVILPYK